MSSPRRPSPPATPRRPSPPATPARPSPPASARRPSPPATPARPPPPASARRPSPPASARRPSPPRRGPEAPGEAEGDDGFLGLGGEGGSLLDAVDRVLDKGAVLQGDLVLSVAGVDLVYVRLAALLASVATLVKDEELGAPKALPPALAEAPRAKRPAKRTRRVSLARALDAPRRK